MDSLKVTIAPEDWGNLVTKYAPHAKKVKTGDFSAGSKNWDTDVNGFITKRKGGPNYNSIALSGSTKDQYEAIFSDGTRHLLVVTGGTFKYSSGDTIFNTVQNGSGFAAAANFEFVTTQNRVYGGNTAAAIVYDRTTSYGGVGYTAPRIKTMGAQAPLTAPTAGAPTAGGNVPAGAHTYKVTFLYYDSEESNGSPASGVQTAGAGNFTIPLTAIPIGGYGVTARKIYRDNNDGNWLHLTTISDNTTTTFNDTLLAGVTPTPIPTDNNVPPAFGLIASWLDKVWIGQISGDPFTLRHSEAGLPDIFPDEFEVLCNEQDPMTALIVYFGRLMVFNRKSFGQILGNTSDTFKYDQIPSSVGCVDNRTLQIRVVNGVPVLIWLSDRGFYRYDGNSVDYISDWIEDLVNFNIQQAIQQKNSSTQSSQADFQGGTSSPGINLDTFIGSITTKGYNDGSSAAGNNPRRTWDDQTDWENGQGKINIRTRSNGNALQAVTRFAPAVGSGVNQGTLVSGGLIKLPQSTPFSGETSSLGSLTSTPFPHLHDVAVAIIPPRNGTLTAIKFAVEFSGTSNFTVSVQTNSGGQPSGTILGSANLLGNASALFTSSALSVPLTGGVTYWLVVTSQGTQQIRNVRNGSALSGASTRTRANNGSGGISGTWGNPFSITAAAGYNFTYTAVGQSGTWVSPTYDTQSVNLTGNGTLSFSTFTIPNSLVTKVGAIYEYSDDEVTFAVLTTTPPIAMQPFVFALGNKRYYRVKVTLSTTDDVFTPSVSAPVLTFVANQVAQPAEWVSENIDTTADSTVYNALTVVSSTPAGTSIETKIATSTDGISFPDGFVTFGTQTVRRYAKIRIRLTMDSTQATTPSVTSVTFKWTVVSNLISSAIDTAATPPAGWDLFLATYTANGGTVQFQMRSGASLIALAAATFFTVTPGDFPSAVTPLQFTQWKVIITSSDGQVPVIDSVTIQWFIGNTNSIRPASIFVDGRYYCALAELEQTTNNIILELDLNGKWRIHEDLKISTFSYFFNRPYCGMADSAYIRKFLGADTDNGVAIELDVRTKAFDFSTAYQDNSEYVKVVGRAILQITNTGASYKVFYSVDNGSTFYPMYLDNGSDTLTTTNDGMTSYRTFKPKWVSPGVPFAGRTVMYRFWSSDINQVEIQSFKGEALKRLQEPE